MPIMASRMISKVRPFRVCSQASARLSPRSRRWHASTTARGIGSGSGVDFADAVVGAVRDVEIAGRIDGHGGRQVQLGAEGRSIVPSIPGCPVARDGGDDPGDRVDPANETVELIGKVEIAGCIDRDTVWTGQRGIQVSASVAYGIRGARACARRGAPPAMVLMMPGVNATCGPVPTPVKPKVNVPRLVMAVSGTPRNPG